MTPDHGAGPAGQPELELTFPSTPEYVGTARHTVAALARLHEADDDVVEDIKLAVSEACTNAVTANARAGAPDPVRVVAGLRGESIVIEVFDAAGTDLELIGQEAELDMADPSFERVLSLPLIRGLVDELDIVPREGGGTVVRMRVALANGDLPAE